MESIVISDIDILIRLVVAMFLGMALGVERTIAGKTAGMRTYAIVSVGAAVFVVVGIIVAESYIGLTTLDPLRMASQIIVGIGFIGAGLILLRGTKLRGLTTAAGLWVASGIGMAAGFGIYSVAVFATIITLLVFTIIWYLENRVVKKLKNKKTEVEVEVVESEEDLL